MYTYKWDPETGGLLLNSSPLGFSKEPRPVYYKELDLLGFDNHWKYDKDDTFPIMWAEANNYWYKGRKIAATRGGSVNNAPSVDFYIEELREGEKLEFVDVSQMVFKNNSILESLVQETIKNIYNTYVEHKKKVDVFYVAFSGGKDSVVTLDLVKKALPGNAFKVLFGDTGMEFPDTYETVDYIENECNRADIEFIRASSGRNPLESWRLFGPPATVSRWCCSVHKTAPQIIALREHTGKTNFTGMAFVGVRAGESLARSEYDYVSLGEKHKGQYSCNPILEWNSAELYLYIFRENLYLNKAYKKGNRRAGCLVCPRAAERNEYMCQAWYTSEFNSYIDVIKDLYKKDFQDEHKLDEFIANGGWKARKNGRDLSIKIGYKEEKKADKQIITVTNPQTDWKTWIVTIGVLITDESPYRILFRDKEYSFEVNDQENGYEVKFDDALSKENPLFVKLLKNVFRRAASCVLCRECEADCHNGCIIMKDGKLKISSSCVHCAQCHKAEKGCLRYKSLEMPKGGLIMSENKSLNCYSHHAPKMEWINQYFEYKNEFDQKHSLGSQMYSFFKRFLRDANLLDSSGFTKTAEVVENIGIDTESAWAIILTNLAYTPQVNWYVKRFHLGESYAKDYAISLLVNDGAKESWVNDIWSSLGRLVELPLKDVGLGEGNKEKNKMVSFVRTSWQAPDPKVVLYSLYKFAEACGNYHQFTLSRLLNHDIDSDGVSPTEIFGINRDEMERILNGLSVNYPDFINASFTLDLDNITLRSDKTALDVLDLF